MDAATRRIFDRMRLHEMMEEHPEWTVTQYAAELGRSRAFVYEWQDRINDPNNKTFRDKYMSRSCAPKSNEKWVQPEVGKAIIELREELSEKYARKAGPLLIISELRKREDLKDQGYYLPTSPTTIAAILRKHGYILPKIDYQYHPIILPEPNEEWEVDFGLTQLGDRSWFEFFGVVDRGSSRIVYLEGDERYNAETSLEAFARLFIQHGMPKRIRMDRDTRFVASWTSDGYSSAFIRFLRVLGVEVIVCPPRQPWKKPFVERAIYTIKHEGFVKYPMNDIAEALEWFKEFYHEERPHQGRACGGKTPNEAFPSLPPTQHIPEVVQPNSWLEHDHGRVCRRNVNSRGFIQVDKDRYYIGKQHAKKRVLVHLDAPNQRFFVNDGERVVAELEIKGLSNQQTVSFNDYLKQMKLEARSVEYHRFMMWHRRSDDAA
mgnify:CR=1 FL=1